MPLLPPCAILPTPIAIPKITSATRSSTFNYYGPVQSSLASEASQFLATTTDAGKLEVASTIASFIHATQDDCIGGANEKTACWLTIRVTKPTDEFKVPRWHQDGRMFPCDLGRENEVRSKYALALLGPRTLMLQPNASVFSTYQRGLKEHYWWHGTHGEAPTEEEEEKADSILRHWLAAEFKDASRVPVGDGEVVRFSWGCEDSPMHSEPDMVCDRVFVSVLYGSEHEIRMMCEWRNVQYGKFDW
jgi:hypothetical protein